MPTEQPTQQFCLQVKTELEALCEVLHWFEQISTSRLPEQFRWQCQVALAEGFTNAVRHAHQNLPKKTSIDLEVTFSPNCLEIRIYDQGQPFDLEAKLKSLDRHRCDPLEQEGGRGLLFMQQLTDELHYTRMPDQHNCLVMRKAISH